MGRDLARRIEDRLGAIGYISPRAHVRVEVRDEGRRLLVAEVVIGDGRRAACSAYEDGLLGNAARGTYGDDVVFDGIEVPFGGPSYTERVREAAEDLFVEEAIASLREVLKKGEEVAR